MSTGDDAHPSMPTLVCAGCGAEVEAIGAGGAASRCPRAGDDEIDHVLRPVPPDTHAHWPAPGASANPFVRYRTLLASYRAARALGMSDEAFVSLVDDLDDRIAARGWRRVSCDTAARRDHARGEPRDAVRQPDRQGRGRSRLGLAQGTPPHGHHADARGRGVGASRLAGSLRAGGTTAGRRAGQRQRGRARGPRPPDAVRATRVSRSPVVATRRSRPPSSRARRPANSTCSCPPGRAALSSIGSSPSAPPSPPATAPRASPAIPATSASARGRARRHAVLLPGP